jgi:HAD superfamily PSPase-like hydrolase
VTRTRRFDRAARPDGQRRFDLVCFDVDGTLVVHPENKVVWQILSQRFNGDDRLNQERFRDYVDGRISYSDWVDLDLGDWVAAGATRDQMVEALGELSLIDGARETIEALRATGCRLAVISGTLDLCLDSLFPDHPFDEVYTNRVHFHANGLIAGWAATPFDMEGKAQALREMRDRGGIAPERTAYVGDHLNDLAAIEEAGFSVAFNPKSPAIEEAADVVVRSDDLRAVLPHLLGQVS